MTKTVDELLSGGGVSAKWSDDNRVPQIGKTYKGEVKTLDVSQQTTPEGELKTFKSGDPMLQLVIALATDEGDGDEDDGVRTLYAKGGKGEEGKKGLPMLNAIKAAIAKAGAKTIEAGGTLAVQLVDVGTPPQRGYNGQLLFVAQYRAPVAKPDSVDVDGLL